MMFDVIVAPTLPRLSDAPITAIDFGDKITDSAMLFGLGFYIIKLFLEISDLWFYLPSIFSAKSSLLGTI